MAITYSIAPNPHWVIIDNFSKLPTGAAIYTYSHLNPSQYKPAFMDASNNFPYTQPIVGFGNGTMPPIFWASDSSNPDDTYYIRVFDSDDLATQQFLWAFDGLSGGSGGGGGGGVTTAYDIENLVINGVFYRNIGDQMGTPSLPTFLTLAPSNNAGLVGNAADTNGQAAPDIIFAKNNTSSTDQINFTTFTPLGINPLPASQTPLQYFNYQCTGAGAGETYKYVQFPICQGVENLSAQTVSVKIFARCNSGNPNLTLTWRQFYGNGGAPSADQTSVISGGPLGLTNVWQAFTFVGVVTPDAVGKTLGSCGNDALFLQVGFPLSPATTNIDFIKPSVYLGSIVPGQDFHTNDMINSIVNSPRTGDIRTSLNAFLLGWVNMNDGTIGDATSNSTSRANIDTFPLFNLIWNTFSTNQTLAPMYTSAGAPVAYGASSIADFTAHNRLSLTRNLGRVMAGALPIDVSQVFTNVGNIMTVTSTASFYTGVPVIVSGGGLPTPLVAGTTYYAIMLSATTMSLASSAANAIAGTPIVLTSNAGGTVIVPAHTLGSFLGEEAHTLTIGEMPAHNHPGSVLQGTTVGCGAGGTTVIGEPGAANNYALIIASQGGGAAHNVMQPTVFMNVMIKL